MGPMGLQLINPQGFIKVSRSDERTSYCRYQKAPTGGLTSSKGGFHCFTSHFWKIIPGTCWQIVLPKPVQKLFFPLSRHHQSMDPVLLLVNPPQKYIHTVTYIYMGIVWLRALCSGMDGSHWGLLTRLSRYIYICIYICIVLHGPFPNAPWVGVSFCLSPGCFRGDGTRFRNLLPVDAKRGGRWDYCWHHGPMGIRWRYLGHFWVFKNDFSACLLMPWSLTDSHGLGRDRGLDWMISGRSRGVLATEIRQT